MRTAQEERITLRKFGRYADALVTYGLDAPETQVVFKRYRRDPSVCYLNSRLYKYLKSFRNSRKTLLLIRSYKKEDLYTSLHPYIYGNNTL
jgi:hypothetical protein